MLTECWKSQLREKKKNEKKIVVNEEGIYKNDCRAKKENSLLKNSSVAYFNDPL